ncbi:flavin reductase family protein (plasmid) [Sphingobium fuliginis]|jgi:flavin reductase (DIM6/NTAB) family NADH-FMN oxidoreductase RutF|uniref:Flavin reductase family protein n=1 Tax=Sphingobium fuliginis (strain ATCC 27551) TaxID=336203 RepID=A0A7M2GPL8_SPHSA|nr:MULTISPECIES: flavin reductase family protein [Sphingobium]QOT74473.1 flavin reductase family protein [Sphingobium fuliginis]
MHDTHFYEPRAGHGLTRDPLRAILGPRPIGWISSRSAAGVANLAPYSFFSMLCDKPPIIGFSSIGEKDSLANIRETGVFACNLVTRRHAEAMNISSRPAPPGIDEFEEAGLKSADCTIIDCPRVAETPVALECRLIDIRGLTDAAGSPTSAWLTLGEIVGVHIDRTLLRDGLFDTASAGIVLRAGYAADYFEIGSTAAFTMKRPAG